MNCCRNITALGVCDGGECGLTQCTPIPDIDNNGEATVSDADLADGDDKMPEEAPDGVDVIPGLESDVEVRSLLHCCHADIHDILLSADGS